MSWTRLPFTRRVAVRSLLAILAVTLAPARSSAALIHDYVISDSLADSFGGPSLVAQGGFLNSAGYSFTNNQGLTLSGGVPNTANYSIELWVSFQINPGYNKILDFKNRTSDNGMYLYSGLPGEANLLLYPYSIEGPAVLTDDAELKLVFTRTQATNIFAWYVNGLPDGSNADSSLVTTLTGPGGIIHFFRDDTSFTGESPTGIVTRIRIYDAPLSAAQVAALVPEPSSLTLAGIGLIGLVIGFRRHLRRAA